MNPLLASPRLETVAGQDSELVFLEGLLNDDCKCEANEHGDFQCSNEVTHQFKCCGYSQLICDTRTAYIEAYREGVLLCAQCGGFAYHCWTIRPI